MKETDTPEWLGLLEHNTTRKRNRPQAQTSMDDRGRSDWGTTERVPV